MSGESGFTTIELLATTAIVGIMVAMSVPVYNVVLDQAEIGFVNQTLDTAYTALQAGIMDEKQRGSTSSRYILERTKGALTDSDAPYIVPQYHPPTTRLVRSQFYYNPSCLIGCWRHYALIMSCKKNRNGTFYYRYKGVYNNVMKDSGLRELSGNSC